MKVDLNVLVADDEATNQRVLRAMLTKLGCRFTIVENGRLAVEAFATGEFDFVLLDLQMPELDGFGAARAIRERGEVPLVAMSGTVPEPEVYRAAGFATALTKPLRLDVLREALTTYAKQSTR